MNLPKHPEPRKIEQAGLYDPVNDMNETKNAAARHPEIVQRFEAEAEKARRD